MWVAGRRGFKFQTKDRRVIMLAPGTPVPDAASFRNRKPLISVGMLEWKEEVESEKKVSAPVEKPEVNEPENKEEPKSLPKKPKSKKNKKKKKAKK